MSPILQFVTLQTHTHSALWLKVYSLFGTNFKIWRLEAMLIIKCILETIFLKRNCNCSYWVTVYIFLPLGYMPLKFQFIFF